MYGENQIEMQCAEFEALLAEALDGTLSGPTRDAFEAHRAACIHCAPAFAEAEAGHRWLRALKEEQPEPSARLVANILQATSGAAVPVREVRVSLWQRLRQMPGLAPVLGVVLQPRFGMAFAMTFFSFSVLLNLAGVKLRDIRHVDLRPSAVVRGFYETQGKVVKFYDNLRVVYEFQTQVRNLKQAIPSEEPSEKPNPPKEQKQNHSGEPEPDKFRNYSLDEARPQLAANPGALRQDRRWS